MSKKKSKSLSIGLDESFRKAQRQAIVSELRKRSDLTLGELFHYFNDELLGYELMSSISINEILGNSVCRKNKKTDCGLNDYDESILLILKSENGRPLTSSYIRARAGGSNWEWRTSIDKLQALKLIIKTGKTVDCRYRISE